MLGSGGDGPLQVLCVGAHSDDIEIGCGATILDLIARRRVRMTWIVLSGSGAREREARRSARLFLGKTPSEVTVGSFRDGFFPYLPEIKEFFEGLKSRVSPDLVFTHYRHDRHQDHRVVSDLTWNTFRDHLILEYEIPKYDGDLGRPNLFAPTSAAVAKRKTRYLRTAFVTQRDRHWFTEETFLGLMRVRGLESRAAGGYAEAFHLRKAVLGPDLLAGRQRRR
jgi:LmbE family N-acetylglucosaminyl deacetylase